MQSMGVWRAGQQTKQQENPSKTHFSLGSAFPSPLPFFLRPPKREFPFLPGESPGILEEPCPPFPFLKKKGILKKRIPFCHSLFLFGMYLHTVAAYVGIK